VKISVCCSWCHEANDISLVGRKLFCWSCGHRPDVPRIQCDCRKCRIQHVPAESRKESRKGAAA
jgi:hypothetical protein